jgi:ATP-binding cassette subfamily B protein
VAFVGPSGAGKSTVVKLLAGLYAPESGRVLAGGTDLRDIDPEAFRHKLGLVPQDAHLFSGTIGTNLRFARPDATDAQCWQALREAALADFVEGLPDKLDARVGEGGLKLSGGQKQRLAIARALLRDPQAIIFDEATSSLDTLAEKEIGLAIEAVRAQRPKLITILIAHRLSTVMAADRIYVLEKGRVAEVGTHEQLVEAKGLYWALWREQAGAR